MKNFEHEDIIIHHDKKLGLKIFIAIHDSTLGPACGGTRIWNFNSDSEALEDVLRLSRGMTYKSAMANIGFGGGKALILADAQKMNDRKYFHAFADILNELKGKYITAEDVGMNTEKIAWIYEKSKHVVGKPASLGGSDDPSPVTAYGVFMGIKASAKFAYGSDELKNKKILIQGAGNVGSNLCNLLTKSSAKVFITDLFPEKAKSVANTYGAKFVPNDEIFNDRYDIFSPCALGGIINDQTLENPCFDIIAGAANNQLLNESTHDDIIQKKGLVYAPDFVINAGGIINCYAEYAHLENAFVKQKTEEIYNSTLEILNQSKKENIGSQKIAIELAKNRIALKA